MNYFILVPDHHMSLFLTVVDEPFVIQRSSHRKIAKRYGCEAEYITGDAIQNHLNDFYFYRYVSQVSKEINEKHKKSATRHSVEYLIYKHKLNTNPHYILHAKDGKARLLLFILRIL